MENLAILKPPVLTKGPLVGIPIPAVHRTLMQGEEDLEEEVVPEGGGWVGHPPQGVPEEDLGGTISLQAGGQVHPSLHEEDRQPSRQFRKSIQQWIFRSSQPAIKSADWLCIAHGFSKSMGKFNPKYSRGPR